MGVSGPASCTPSTIYSAIGYAVIGKVFKSGYQRYTMRMAVPLMKNKDEWAGVVCWPGLQSRTGPRVALTDLLVSAWTSDGGWPWGESRRGGAGIDEVRHPGGAPEQLHADALV